MAGNELPVLGQATKAAGAAADDGRGAGAAPRPGNADGPAPVVVTGGRTARGPDPGVRLGRGPIGAVIGPTERSGGGGDALVSGAEALARAEEEAGVSPEPSIPTDAPAATRRLWAALCEVRDPELPVSLVDLGLIYGIRREGGRVEVEMTFTAMGCPCMMVMEMDVQDRLLEEDGVEDVEIDVVWNPPWSRERMTEKARKILRKYGVAA